MVGSVWLIIIQIEMQETDIFTDAKNNNFLESYGMTQKTNMQNSIAMQYYALTTLSTVGFGDYHPKSNLERLIICTIFLGGLIIFSLITG